MAINNCKQCHKKLTGWKLTCLHGIWKCSREVRDSLNGWRASIPTNPKVEIQQDREEIANKKRKRVQGWGWRTTVSMSSRDSNWEGIAPEGSDVWPRQPAGGNLSQREKTGARHLNPKTGLRSHRWGPNIKEHSLEIINTSGILNLILNTHFGVYEFSWPQVVKKQWYASLQWQILSFTLCVTYHFQKVHAHLKRQHN